MAADSPIHTISLNDVKTISEFQKRIKEYALALPEKEWIRGMSWHYSIFGESGMPDKKYIDEVI